jgi:hypothetical protein
VLHPVIIVWDTKDMLKAFPKNKTQLKTRKTIEKYRVGGKE